VFNLDFFELGVIGVVALVVLGPERLPRVARTAGHLLSRFQRYVAQVKADINREMELADLKKLQSTVEDTGRSIEQSFRSSLDDAQQQLGSVETELRKTEEELREAAAPLQSVHMGTRPAVEQAEPLPANASPAADPPAGSGTSEVTAGQPLLAAHAAAAGNPEASSPQLELGLDRDSEGGAQRV
jgi:sec-independent protein translocase protein TatB